MNSLLSAGTDPYYYGGNFGDGSSIKRSIIVGAVSGALAGVAAFFIALVFTFPEMNVAAIPFALAIGLGVGIGVGIASSIFYYNVTQHSIIT